MKNSQYSNVTDGLYIPSTEHDSCGVGFIADLTGVQTYKTVCDAITVLENMEHRGATGSDPHTGDGAGILIQIPDKFMRAECEYRDIELPPKGDYATGVVFLPKLSEDRHIIETMFEHVVNQSGQKFLGWRDVPSDNSNIGDVAISVEPVMKQILIARGKDTKVEDFEKILFYIRKKIWQNVGKTEIQQKKHFYVCSLSSKILVYKGQLRAIQLREYFLDFNNETVESAIALVHSRYSTNTFPTWSLAHPYRMIAHNGEINTLRGNVNRFNAREQQFKSKFFGDKLKNIYPIVAPGRSDSATFDNALELLVLNGRDLPHALMMMIPEAWSGDKNMSQEKKDFYKYHSALMEPWDGPSAVAFTDGKYIGSILDRNGLRPARYWETKDNKIIMASEAGVLPVPNCDIIKKGRLQPGKMFLIDIEEGRIIDDSEIKEKYSNKRPYGKWLKENMLELDSLPKIKNEFLLNNAEIKAQQKAFGYTYEDIKIILAPMVEDGIEATGSMGTDTPLAILSKEPQLLFNYFKQLFAQVTNPPIDSIREEIIMGEDVLLGAEKNLLDESPEHAKRVRLKRPIITNSELSRIKLISDTRLKSQTISILFPKSDGLLGIKKKLKLLFKEADKAIDSGYTNIILSDKGVDENNVPIPSLLAVSGLHHYLTRIGTRALTSLVVETGEAREMHHFATLLGYGANAINPYLAFETIKNELDNGNYKISDYEIAEKNYLKAISKGLYKIISKMGISTIQSYSSAQIFEAVGLDVKFIKKYFTATPSRIGGIGIKTITEEALRRHELAYGNKKNEDILDSSGNYRWRAKGEYHQWNPETIKLLQQSVRANDYSIFKKYSELVNDREKNLSTIRSLLQFRKRRPIDINEVEPAEIIMKRFATGAMSYGSISKEAHETLAVAMNRIGGFSNTGEGGEDKSRFSKEENGDWKRSRIKQVAQGRFGVSIEYLVNADQIQIKMAQGAKPGEGGQLPGHKVSEQIAKTRGTTAGVGLISPPPHHDIYSIEDLKQLIHDLKNANPEAEISVKLVSEVGVGTIAAGVAKGKADHILISGFDGGTGASPQTSIKHTGLPLELGLAETQQVLIMNNLRERVRIQADGQLKTGRDVAIAALLGADEFGFATSALVTMGCVLQRNCHLNTCSVGIATQDPELRKKFQGKPEHVISFFKFIAEEVREIMAEFGFKTVDEMIGRVDLLEMAEVNNHWKLKGIDITNVLHRTDVPHNTLVRHALKQDHELEFALDNKLISSCRKSIQTQAPVRFSVDINNTNRSVGTMLSSYIVKKYEMRGLQEDTIQIDFIGTAGQSFGAFLANGITFRLEGDTNDYVGKGLSGGKIIVVPQEDSKFLAEENIIVGNVVLYGAIKGELYLRGKAGERFAVRNSGASAVVEGIGDHGCEYMTGGTVVVLGDVGKNFAAGMSGGLAYVWDKSDNFNKLYNSEMVELFKVEDSKDIDELKTIIEKHKIYTNSTVAEKILSNWEKYLPQFVKVYPTDYRRVLELEKTNEQATNNK
ncbi:MAG: glutamate synthase large subunit [Bacteroidetes bacterium]|nr:glutamate synthase large subunit [Bacteroidota bacterium]MBU1113534.1 glutamate synthase large subunit [Bacteroidota bacterium]MBU1797482.1 glutamate synthase large subunit [Bacteroidota bacterium]